jgi:hypothetical protein
MLATDRVYAGVPLAFRRACTQTVLPNHEETSVGMLKSYFDLTPRERGPQTGVVLLPWWPQYLTLVLGITIQPFFEAYQQTAHWEVSGAIGRFAFAIIVGLLIFPSVYRGAFDSEKPIFTQLCAIFAAGMGWQSLLHTAATGLTH